MDEINKLIDKLIEPIMNSCRSIPNMYLIIWNNIQIWLRDANKLTNEPHWMEIPF